MSLSSRQAVVVKVDVNQDRNWNQIGAIGEAPLNSPGRGQIQGRAGAGVG